MAGIRSYRVYFNRAEDAPQIWSIDEGTVASEINVLSVKVQAPGFTRSNLDAQFPEPKAWIEVDGHLSIVNGVALIW